MPTFGEILKEIEKVTNRLGRSIPATEKALFSSIQDELKKLDTVNGKIKTTVKNISVIDSIQKKLNRLILNQEYLKDVKEYAKGYNEITALQNQYWKQAESSFKPRPLLKAIRVQAIQNTVSDLAGQGIAEAIAEPIKQILRTNITTGGSYSELTDQLRNLITESNTPGLLDKTIKQVALDSLNQYTAQYNQVVSSDLGFEWYSWQGTEVFYSRPFCQAMVQNHRYFHISSIPYLLKGQDENGNPLPYTDVKNNKSKTVGLYDKTGLPQGFIDGTNESNFLIRRGGYNCGHQARPVSEDLVKYQDEALYNRITNSQAYKAWQAGKGVKPQTKEEKPKESVKNKQEQPKPDKPKPEAVLEARQEPDNKKPIRRDPPRVKASEDLRKAINPAIIRVRDTERLKQNQLQLTDDEKAAINDYTSSGFRGLNSYLRNAENTEPSQRKTMQEYKELLNQALDALDEAQTYKGDVYRGIRQYINTDRYEVGKVITEPQFTSTSYDPKKAFEGSVVFQIRSKNGKYVRDLGNYEDDEAEILFKADTKFKVTDKQDLNGKTYITMEEQ